MSVIGDFPLVLEQNADRPAIVFTWYPNWTPASNGTPFDFSGYSSQAMFRQNVGDVSSLLTITPVLGGTAGTLTVGPIVAATVNTLLAALSGNTCWWDIIITSGGGAITKWIEASKVTIRGTVTHP